MACEAMAFARAGLVGNPSDGYFGKTISFVIRDFAAKVSLYEHPEVEIVPSLQDRSKYGSVHDLVQDVYSNGYYGGIRVLKATICKFVEYCQENEIELPKRNFSIRYRSTIPRRLGLAGSSALVTATLRCLMEFYEVEIPQEIQPNLILRVETEELNISAGLQDRVIQVYEGLVYMDFDKAYMESQGHGRYIPLDPSTLPNLYIAYQRDLGEGSETFHNNIRGRWMNGDPEVVQAMQDFAGYTDEVYKLLQSGRGEEIGYWLDKNFDRRCSIFKLDLRNIDMVERARSVGASGKFAGSGGAIVGTFEDDAMYERLVEVMNQGDIAVFRPQIEA